jgi:DNA-binding NtrC family response regulator
MRIAVVDDEEIVCRRLKAAMEKDGYQVEAFARGEEVLNAMARESFDLLILDVLLPGLDGMEVLRRVKEEHRDTEVILITGRASISAAVEAMKKGAFHYVEKPFRMDELKNLVRQALAKKALTDENKLLKARLAPIEGYLDMVGVSAPIKAILDLVRKVAPLDCNVLIQGETGTGKELVARLIHARSKRADRPFVAFNCGGFTEELIASELFGYERGAFTGAVGTKVGLLETAQGGTVFMDEVSDMPLSMQAKLLRVIQEKRIFRVGGTRPIQLDVRFVAATNRDLRSAVQEGRFREDLYFRLNVVQISIPPLSERKEDIMVLTHHFLDLYSKKFGKQISGIDPVAREALLRYSYPGNVRELQNVIERAVALAEGPVLRLEDLPSEFHFLPRENTAGWKTLEEQERDYIEQVLASTGRKVGEAARILRLPRTTLWRKMKKYGLLGPAT